MIGGLTIGTWYLGALGALVNTHVFQELLVIHMALQTPEVTGATLETPEAQNLTLAVPTIENEVLT